MTMDTRTRHTTFRDRLRSLWEDESGQGMTEYVILTAVTVVLAAYLYYPDNAIYRGVRVNFVKAVLICRHMGP